MCTEVSSLIYLGILSSCELIYQILVPIKDRFSNTVYFNFIRVDPYVAYFCLAM